MAQPNGYGSTASNVVTVDQPFGMWVDGAAVIGVDNVAGSPIVSIMISCSTTGGVIVWNNAMGVTNVTSIAAGQSKLLFATKVLSSGTAYGNPVATTAVGLYWESSPNA